MNAKLKMAFGSYFIAALLILLIGLVYSTRTEVMPYHLEVLGMSWGEIQPQVQFMLLAFLHGGGAGALANGAALMFLLFVPFKNRENWSRWALSVIGLVASLPMLYIVLKVKFETPASPPLGVIFLINLLFVVGFVLSTGFNRKQNAEG